MSWVTHSDLPKGGLKGQIVPNPVYTALLLLAHCPVSFLLLLKKKNTAAKEISGKKRLILLTTPGYGPIIVEKPRWDLLLVLAHPQLRAEGTECVRVHTGLIVLSFTPPHLESLGTPA